MKKTTVLFRGGGKGPKPTGTRPVCLRRAALWPGTSREGSEPPGRGGQGLFPGSAGAPAGEGGGRSRPGGQERPLWGCSCWRPSERRPATRPPRPGYSKCRSRRAVRGRGDRAASSPAPCSPLGIPPLLGEPAERRSRQRIPSHRGRRSARRGLRGGAGGAGLRGRWGWRCGAEGAAGLSAMRCPRRRTEAASLPRGWPGRGRVRRPGACWMWGRACVWGGGPRRGFAVALPRQRVPPLPVQGRGRRGVSPQKKTLRNQTKDLSAQGSLLAHVSPHSRPTERLHSWCWWCSGFSEYPEYEKSMWKAAGSEMRSFPRAALQELLPQCPCCGVQQAWGWWTRTCRASRFFGLTELRQYRLFVMSPFNVFGEMWKKDVADSISEGFAVHVGFV